MSTDPMAWVLAAGLRWLIAPQALTFALLQQRLVETSQGAIHLRGLGAAPSPSMAEWTSVAIIWQDEQLGEVLFAPEHAEIDLQLRESITNLCKLLVLRALQAVAPNDTTIHFPPAPSGMHLTDREVEVLVAMAQYRDEHIVGEILHISSKTVHTHLNRMYQKLQVTSLEGAVRQSWDGGHLAQHGLTTPLILAPKPLRRGKGND